MQCVICAAGKGTRMRPLTETLPKPLVPIAGKPILSRIIDALPAAVDEVVLVVKYRGEQIRAYYGDTYGGRRVTYVEQGVPDGTGGALLAARPALHGRFMVMYADDLHGSEALHALLEHEVAILGATVEDPRPFGVLMRSPDGMLECIEEKPEHPKSNLVNTGTMVLDERIFTYPTPAVGDEVYLTDMLTLFARDVPMPVVVQPRWCPVGRPEDIPRAEQFIGNE